MDKNCRVPLALVVVGLVVFGGIWFGASLPAVVFSSALAGPSSEDETDKKVDKLPPLVIDRDTPLLLDESSDKQGNAELRLINAACFVCHGNYEEETLVTIHAKEEIGCTECHGQSFAHRNDENNVTPPDTMYPLEKIDRACQKCHHTHDASATEVLARWQQRCPEKKDVSQIVCTDCHGKHRLTQRVVRWDKRTGKLIADPPAESEAVDAKSSGKPVE